MNTKNNNKKKHTKEMHLFEQYVHLIAVDILEHDVQLIKHQQQIHFLVATTKKKNSLII